MKKADESEALWPIRQQDHGCESWTGVTIVLKSHSGTLIRGNGLWIIQEQWVIGRKRKSPVGVMPWSHLHESEQSLINNSDSRTILQCFALHKACANFTSVCTGEKKTLITRWNINRLAWIFVQDFIYVVASALYKNIHVNPLIYVFDHTHQCRTAIICYILDRSLCKVRSRF